MALKEVVDELESEVYSDVDAYKNEQAFSAAPRDYDEMFDAILQQSRIILIVLITWVRNSGDIRHIFLRLWSRLN